MADTCGVVLSQGHTSRVHLYTLAVTAARGPSDVDWQQVQRIVSIMSRHKVSSRRCPVALQHTDGAACTGAVIALAPDIIAVLFSGPGRACASRLLEQGEHESGHWACHVLHGLITHCAMLCQTFALLPKPWSSGSGRHSTPVQCDKDNGSSW